jgi:hypothetical protein
MKTAEVGFRFPVLGFTEDLEIWGFQDLDRLTRCGPRTLKEDLQRGMELIDAEGRCWVVRSIKKTGRAGSLLSVLLPFGPAQSRIEHELDALPPVTLEDVRRRACRAMEAFSENYVDSDEDKAEFDQLLVKVKQAGKISEVYDLLQPDTFEPL